MEGTRARRMFGHAGTRARGHANIDGTRACRKFGHAGTRARGHANIEGTRARRARRARQLTDSPVSLTGLMYFHAIFAIVIVCHCKLYENKNLKKNHSEQFLLDK